MFPSHRFENLQGDIKLLSPTSAGPGLTHHRSPSGISNISLESEASSMSDVRNDQAQAKPPQDNDEVRGGWYSAGI